MAAATLSIYSELHDAHGMAGGVRFLGDAQSERVFGRFQVSSEHDGAWIVQVLAEAVKKVHIVERHTVHTGFDDACVRAGEDVRADGGAGESEGQLSAWSVRA